MDIKVLGIDSENCRKLYEVVKEVVSEIEDGITVEYIDAKQEISNDTDIATPVLIIDNMIVSKGKVLTAEEVIDLIDEYSETDGCDCNNCSGSCGCSHHE